jgi:hypothetical protein
VQALLELRVKLICYVMLELFTLNVLLKYDNML